MDYTIHPYEGVGPIQLGMTQAQIRALLGVPSRTTLRRNNNYVDRFSEARIRIHYTSSLICDAIEVLPPASAIFLNQDLLADRPFKQLIDWLKQQDETIEIDSDGAKSDKYGISLYAPNLDEPVKAAACFAHGHYDGVDEEIEAFKVELDRRLAAGLEIDDLLRS